MAKYPKMVFRKDNPAELQIVNKMRYHVLIYEGWGVVSASKFSRRCTVLLEKMRMDFDQFWELVLKTIPDPVRSKRWYREAIEGRIDDSHVDFLLLHVVTTAARQPIAYFTQEKDRVPVWPWKHWDLNKAAAAAQTIRWFEIHYTTQTGNSGTRNLSAHDETHARGIWVARYPTTKIDSVRELPAVPGTEIG